MDQNIDGLINKKYFYFLFIIIIGVIAYSPVLNGPFFFDDEHFIVKNRSVHELNISEIYSSSTTSGAMIEGNFYRPNQQLLYGLIYEFFDTHSSFPYHFVQTILHSINSVLLMNLLMMLGLKLIPAFVGAIWFLVHPVQAEAVAYISGLSDPLSMIFILSGLSVWIVYLNDFENRKFLSTVISVSLLFILSLFTRESSVVFVPMALLLLFYMSYQRKLPINRLEWGGGRLAKFSSTDIYNTSLYNL